MNIATASQLPFDFPKDPDVDGPTILRVVPVTEPAPVERLATVHRLVTDVLAAEPAVVGAVRRQTGPIGVGPAVKLSPSVYRRRRFMVSVVLGLLVSAVSLLGGELIGRVTGTTGAPVVAAVGEPVVYVVQPGDTLWSIAGSINPEGRDVRSTVDRLAEAAGGPILQPGQLIVLPVG